MTKNVTHWEGALASVKEISAIRSSPPRGAHGGPTSPYAPLHTLVANRIPPLKDGQSMTNFYGWEFSCTEEARSVCKSIRDWSVRLQPATYHFVAYVSDNELWIARVHGPDPRRKRGEAK
jgi:hypothetical protein